MKSRDRLSRILRIKERIRDARRGAVASADAARNQAASELERRQGDMTQLADRYSSPGEMSADELAHRAAMVERARRRARIQAEELARVSEVRAERAIELAQAGRELASLEVLEHRRRQAAQRDLDSSEQLLADDSAANTARMREAKQAR